SFLLRPLRIISERSRSASYDVAFARRRSFRLEKEHAVLRLTSASRRISARFLRHAIIINLIEPQQAHGHTNPSATPSCLHLPLRLAYRREEPHLSHAKREALKAMESRMQARWAAERVFEADAPLAGSAEPPRDKYMVTFPYPYVNG